jgi:hypothetical protein
MFESNDQKIFSQMLVIYAIIECITFSLNAKYPVFRIFGFGFRILKYFSNFCDWIMKIISWILLYMILKKKIKNLLTIRKVLRKILTLMRPTLISNTKYIIIIHQFFHFLKFSSLIQIDWMKFWVFGEIGWNVNTIT